MSNGAAVDNAESFIAEVECCIETLLLQETHCTLRKVAAYLSMQKKAKRLRPNCGLPKRALGNRRRGGRNDALCKLDA
jgi:hypothetical protein